MTAQTQAGDVRRLGRANRRGHDRARRQNDRQQQKKGRASHGPSAEYMPRMPHLGIPFRRRGTGAARSAHARQHRYAKPLETIAFL